MKKAVRLLSFSLNKDCNIVDAEIELLNSPIFKNLIISEDATTTGLLINLKKNLEFDAIVNERIRLNELGKKNDTECV